MKKQTTKNNEFKAPNRIHTSNFNWINIIILLGYGFITVFTPEFNSFDLNGPKFLTFAALNLIVLIYLIIIEIQKKKSNPLSIFFKTKIGIFYTLLIVFSLLSFFKSINISESIVHFTKILTPFISAIIIAEIIRKDKGSLIFLIAGLTGLLIFDSIKVFLEINNYILGEINDIILITAGYSNKNVLAASLFVKIPFALYLLIFKKGWLKKIGVIGIFLGTLSILFLSTRSIYLGLIFISLFFIGFLIAKYLQSKDKVNLKNLITYFTSLILAILIYSLIQNYLYPKTESLYNQSATNRITSIQTEAEGGERLRSWKQTIELIVENPISGVGLGNWKILILEKENPTRKDFTYHFKTHNDFLEIIAEVGILGGLCFIAIFIIIIVNFLKHLGANIHVENYDLLFLSAFGIFAYSFDAFFNFPQDRPQLQSLFAIYIGIGVGISQIWLRKKEDISEKNTTEKYVKDKSYTPLIIIVLLLFFTMASIYILSLNLKSLQIQRDLKEEISSNKKTISSDFLIQNFPSIPNLSAVGDPINTLIAKKLIDEGKNETALIFLKDNHSPYDTRREFYLSLAYLNLNKLDSALHYIEFANKLKPKYYVYVKHYANILEKGGMDNEAISMLDDFLSQNKDELEAWKYDIALNNKIDNKEKVFQLLDSAQRYYPLDSTLANLKNYYSYNYNIPYYKEATTNYNEGNFKEAAKYFQMSESNFEEFGNPAELPNFLNSWAHSLLQINDISNAKSIFERVSNNYPNDYFSLKNLGFIALQHEKNYTKAIDYYTKSLSADSADLFQSYANLGTIYLLQNQKDLAILNYENSLKYGTSETAIRNLTILWKEKGDQKKSQYYQSLLPSN